MDIAAAPERQYEIAARGLFPKGDYWDRQLADPESDASLFARAKAAGIFEFRRRMSDLYSESRVGTALETLCDWERVLLGAPNPWLDIAERRARLAAVGKGRPTIGGIKEVGRMFGIDVTGVSLPFRPAFFGHCRFGIDRMADESGFSTVVIRAAAAGDRRAEFEARVRAMLLVTNIVHFIYGG